MREVFLILENGGCWGRGAKKETRKGRNDFTFYDSTMFVGSLHLEVTGPSAPQYDISQTSRPRINAKRGLIDGKAD